MVYREIPYPIVRMDVRSPMDVYVKVREDYRLFAAKGALFTAEHCRMFDRTALKLFVTARDHESADKLLESFLLDTLTDPQLNTKAKAEIIYSSSMDSIRKVFETTNIKTITELERLSGSMTRLILSDSRVMDDLISVTSHDHYTYQHSVKVGIYGTALSFSLFKDKIHEHNMAELSTAFFLHDIGMAKVPEKILDKRDPLTVSEWDILKRHPIWGHEKLVKANYLSDEANAIVLYHHERCDRNGYPFRKSGDEIPLYAKICAVADTFESLTSARPFRQSKTPFEALKIMQSEMAHEFDLDIFTAFIKLLGPS
ncbi:MAG TPA: HD domain-containing protein [Deltaproteobacteria bacterium]|nr:HD domain-containing protein [Deltaproteobacteria bacterium]HQI01388.1 HD domain-containing protein [Deltaproteobacteria bacterium]HQJ10109.1 HD domain-containing protein [Deltaproteobacteria bacterium]